MVRMGAMTREKGLKKLEESGNKETAEYVKKKLR
jgi:flagellar motor component MotA